jgi:hypothetical protein
VGDATVDLAFGTPVSSSEEAGMALAKVTIGVIATSTSAASCPACLSRASRVASVIHWMASWVTSSHACERVAAPANVPTPHFTALVAVKVGLWALHFMLKHDKIEGHKGELKDIENTPTVQRLTQTGLRQPASTPSVLSRAPGAG